MVAPEPVPGEGTYEATMPGSRVGCSVNMSTSTPSKVTCHRAAVGGASCAERPIPDTSTPTSRSQATEVTWVSEVETDQTWSRLASLSTPAYARPPRTKATR